MSSEDIFARLEVNGKKPGSVGDLVKSVTDPTMKIIQVDPSANLNEFVMALIKIGLRFLAQRGVPPARARELVEGFGHNGKYALHLFQYDLVMKAKWGDKYDYLTDEQFMHEIGRGKKGLAVAGYKVDDIDKHFENRVLFLRAVLRVAEEYDISPSEAEATMGLFGKSGYCAFETESYRERMLSRRERTRK